MRRKSTASGVLLSAAIAISAWSQTPPDNGRRPEIQFAPPQAAPGPVGFGVGMLAVEPLEMRDPVENEPFSAEIVNELRQQLPDGNRIERRTTGMIARDSRGRLRREQQLAAIGPVVPEGDALMVTISDPVARVHYSLDAVRKVAVVSRPGRTVPAPIEDASRPAASDKIGPRLTIHAREQLGGARIPGPMDVQTEQLGTKILDGVRAEGTRSVSSLPAGAIGNVRAIETVTERWYSSELKVVVLSRRVDPRFGETVYRLRNIVRTEPAAALFQVPSDYKQEDAKAFPAAPPSGPVRVKPLQ